MRNRSAAFLAAGVIGVAALLLGQAWDFYLHAADPTLAHREGIFTLTNPALCLRGRASSLPALASLAPAIRPLRMAPGSRRASWPAFLFRIPWPGYTGVGWL